MYKTIDKTEAAFRELERLMSFHDWYYDYSDDHRVWCRGRDERREINSLSEDLRSNDKSRVETLWDKYCPFRKEQKLD